MRAKRLGELLEGIYGICPQAIEPSHCPGSQTRWENLAHEGLILRMDSHSLIEVAHMFYKVHSTIVNGERGLMESPRKFCPLNLARERWSGDLIKCLAHGVISQAFMRRAFVPTFAMVLFIIGKRFAGWSSWLLHITSILFTFRGEIRIGKGLFLPCMVQLSF